MLILTIKKNSDWKVWDELCINTELISFVALKIWLNRYCKVPLIKVEGIQFINENIFIGGISGIKIGIGKISLFISFSGINVFDEYVLSELDLFTLNDFLINNYFLGSIVYSKTPLLSRKTDNKFSLKKKILYYISKKLPKSPKIGLVDIQETEELYFSSLKPWVRTEIRKGRKQDINIKISTTIENPQNFYKLMIMNSKTNGYNLNIFNDYRKFWKELSYGGLGLFVSLYYDEKLVGFGVFIKCGSMYNYIFGATDREYSKLNSGYLIQDAIINYSRNNGFKIYNISVGGSETVEKFKSNFHRTIKNDFLLYLN